VVSVDSVSAGAAADGGLAAGALSTVPAAPAGGTLEELVFVVMDEADELDVVGAETVLSAGGAVVCVLSVCVCFELVAERVELARAFVLRDFSCVVVVAAEDWGAGLGASRDGCVASRGGTERALVLWFGSGACGAGWSGGAVCGCCGAGCCGAGCSRVCVSCADAMAAAATNASAVRIRHVYRMAVTPY
jgi:hypothetical protein